MGNVVPIVLITVLVMVPGPVSAERNSVAAMITAKDLSPLDGSRWSGSLIYIDYSSGKQQQIPVSVQFDVVHESSIAFHIQYPGETQHNESAMLRIDELGRRLNGELIVQRCRANDGTLVLTTQSQGEDNSRAVDIRMTYSIGGSELLIRKEVRAEGEKNYLQRNQYRLSALAMEDSPAGAP